MWTLTKLRMRDIALCAHNVYNLQVYTLNAPLNRNYKIIEIYVL